MSTAVAKIISAPTTPVKGKRAVKVAIKEEEKDIKENISNIVTPIKEEKKTRSTKQEKEVKSKTPVKIILESDEEEVQDRPEDDMEKCTKTVYRLINKATGALGGNGYNGAIYGELTLGSMQTILDILVKECELDTTSRFIDIGAGLGKPSFHALESPGVALSFGVELEEIRWQLSMLNMKAFLKELKRNRADATAERTVSDNQAIYLVQGDVDVATSMVRALSLIC
jgi:hypothetical protein